MAKTCGTCTLCCTLIPVDALDKAAFKRCPKLRPVGFAAPGCGIYSDRPNECRAWNCQWLGQDDWPDELRPDRCGVVVDIVPDLIMFNGREVTAIQLWAAPGYEMAFTEQPVLALVMAIATQRQAILWRYRGADGEQTARGIALDPKTGKLGVSPESPTNRNFSRAKPLKKRLKQVVQREKIDAQSILARPPIPKG